MNHFSVFSLLIWRRVADTVRSNNNPNRFSYLSFLFCTSAVIILGLGQWVEFGVAGLDFFYKKKIREKKNQSVMKMLTISVFSWAPHIYTEIVFGN